MTNNAKTVMRSLVNDHGMSLMQVADALGVSHQSTRHWWAGDRSPQVSKLISLQRFHSQVITVGVRRAVENVNNHVGETQEAGVLVELINEKPLNERLFIVVTVLNQVQDAIAGTRRDS